MEHDEDQADQQVEEVDGDTNVGAMGQVLGVSPSARCLSKNDVTFDYWIRSLDCRSSTKLLCPHNMHTLENCFAIMANIKTWGR